MSDTFLPLVADYGAIIVALSAYLSCLLIPIPTALVMLAGGAFAAAGDLSLAAVLGAGWFAAVLGDQTGYRIGRVAGPRLRSFFEARPKAQGLYTRSEAFIEKYGGIGVFFSTWALAPLGPYANIAAGAAGLSALRFTLWDAAGEAIWVGGYVLLGYAFASQITEMSSLMSNVAGGIVCAAVALGLVYVLARKFKDHGTANAD